MQDETGGNWDAFAKGPVPENENLNGSGWPMYGPTLSSSKSSMGLFGCMLSCCVAQHRQWKNT